MCKGPYPLDRHAISRQEPAVSRQPIPIGGDLIGGPILNMFDMESRPTLWRVGRRLWRVGRLLHKAHTHTPIVEQLVLESALESADSSSQSADSNANSPKIGVWVWALNVLVV